MSDYCSKYSLTRIPISSNSSYLDGTELKENTWTFISQNLKALISKTPKSTLGHYTLYEILCKLFDKDIVDELISYFPYRSEITTLRADLAFSKEFSAAESFYVIKEGISALIDGMVADLKRRDIHIQCNHRVTGMGSVTLPMSLHCATPTGVKTFSAKKIIFAVHANALRKIRPFVTYPILKHLKMTPLLRTYAIFPNAPHQKKVWFEDMPRVVTRARLRHVIPVNSAKGVIMTSYTDAEDTEFWLSYHKKGKVALADELLAQLRSSFPSKTIPNPLYTSSYYWDDGCTYWTPGSYDPVKESTDIMRPFAGRLPDVYVCGESYSMKQAWMEGALEHADAMLQKYFFRVA
jgi:monoamine oxidase